MSYTGVSDSNITWKLVRSYLLPTFNGECSWKTRKCTSRWEHSALHYSLWRGEIYEKPLINCPKNQNQKFEAVGPRPESSLRVLSTCMRKNQSQRWFVERLFTDQCNFHSLESTVACVLCSRSRAPPNDEHSSGFKLGEFLYVFMDIFSSSRWLADFDFSDVDRHWVSARYAPSGGLSEVQLCAHLPKACLETWALITCFNEILLNWLLTVCEYLIFPNLPLL